MTSESIVRFRWLAPFAGVAHPVERHLAKVEVASSSLVTRSKMKRSTLCSFSIRYHSQAVRQRSAKPRFPSSNLGGTSKSGILRKRDAFFVVFILMNASELKNSEASFMGPENIRKHLIQHRTDKNDPHAEVDPQHGKDKHCKASVDGRCGKHMIYIQGIQIRK